MREIKFRGKSDMTGEDYWVYGMLVDEDIISTDGIGWEQGSLILMNWTYVKPETVGQYTGLKDANGVEIYEGDIVHIYYYLDNDMGETIWFNNKVTVRFVKDDVHYGYLGVDEEDYFDLNYYSDKTVIGNMHEED